MTGDELDCRAIHMAVVDFLSNMGLHPRPLHSPRTRIFELSLDLDHLIALWQALSDTRAEHIAARDSDTDPTKHPKILSGKAVPWSKVRDSATSFC